jgi:Uma2 family endonuclease
MQIFRHTRTREKVSRMATTTRHNARMSVADYLALNEETPPRHDYVMGELFEVESSTTRHNKLVGNIRVQLGSFNQPGIHVLATSVLLQAAEDIYYYPDIMVVQEDDEDNPYIMRRPRVIVEVASPASMSVDLREKLLVYRRLPSLQAYLVVEMNAQRVYRAFRDDAGAWQNDLIEGDEAVPIPCLDIELPLADVYRNLPPVSDT